jgi:alanine racemase
MSPTRRNFLSAVVGTAGLVAVTPDSPHMHGRIRQAVPDGLDPWIEVDGDALRANLAAVSGLAGGRPVLAVIKNNGYGLGTTEVAAALDAESAVHAFAVVKVESALSLRAAGIRKPVLHMGATTLEEARALVHEGVRLSVFDPGDPARVRGLAEELQTPIPVHVYLDTGMRRLGVPAHRALPFLRALSGPHVLVEGTFMGFTESDFDEEQLSRFQRVATEARGVGIGLGLLNAASSHGLFLRPEAHLDMVRPGLALYGSYPSGSDTSKSSLKPAFALRARVARVERLRAGDTVSYGQEWRAQRPTWAATLPVGHADGYPRQAIDGCEVLIGGRLYPVVGAVSASHTIVILGEEASVSVGDVATFVGPDHPAIHPNEIARRTGRSVYDILMHLGQGLPRVMVS